jgi:chorismate synthase
MLRFTTAGESHGPALVAILEGMPAGVPLVAAQVDAQLQRRQQGYGRGRRMQIERDAVTFTGGVRAGETTGAPIAMLVHNRDWPNWEDVMDPAPRPEDADGGRRRVLTRVRPGHADLAGLLKYDRRDARDILERASARETTMRVACGAVARAFLAEFGVRIGSHLVHLGGIDAAPPAIWPEDLAAAADASPLRTLDPAAEARMINAIDAARRDGDTLGGTCEVVATGLPVGLGSHVSWDRKLGGDGGRDRDGVRGGARGRRRRPRPDPPRPRLRPHRRRPPREQPRRWPRGRHDHRRAAGRTPGDEADRHPHAPPRDG